MKKTVRLLLLSLLFGSALAAPTSQVARYLDERHDNEFPYSDPIGRAGDWLPEGGEESYTVTLYAGYRYVFYGACDGNCENLDLTLYSPSGRVVGGDDDSYDEPAFTYRAATTGTYTIEGYMAECFASRCNFGVEVAEE